MYNHATICTQSQKTEGGTKSAVDLTPHHQENLVWQLFLFGLPTFSQILNRFCGVMKNSAMLLFLVCAQAH